MVQHKCGRHYIERNKKNKQEFSGPIAEGPHPFQRITPSKVELYSSYLGKVPVNARNDEDNVYLETVYITEKNRSIYIKVLDLLENNLSDTYVYPLEHLMHLKVVCINKNENLYKYALTLLCYIKINKMENANDNVIKYTKLYNDVTNQIIKDRISKEYPELISESNVLSSKFYKKILQKALEYNSRVDLLFAALEYLEFINRMTNGNIETINNQNILIFISGVPKLDNAYWNGSYMVFGNGDSMFYPLASLDVIGHELTHGLIQGVCDLEYRGHSGALNESYADIFGAMLEFYVYDKYPDRLFGKYDWRIGEDLAIEKSCLRNMQDPHACEQPSKMYDEYYIDPNSMIDYGGVHINSGIPNHCFYLSSQYMDKYEVLKLFIDCLHKLFRQSNFAGFSDTLANLSANDNIYQALDKVGLPQISKPKPQPIPQPQPIPKPQPIPQLPIPNPRPKPIPPPYPYPRYPYPYPYPGQYPPYPQYPYPGHYPPYPGQYPYSGHYPVQYPEYGYPRSPYMCPLQTEDSETTERDYSNDWSRYDQ